MSMTDDRRALLHASNDITLLLRRLHEELGKPGSCSPEWAQMHVIRGLAQALTLIADAPPNSTYWKPNLELLDDLVWGLNVTVSTMRQQAQ